MRTVSSHLLVAIVSLALGYSAAPWLQRLAPGPEVEPPPALPEAAACAPWIDEALALQAHLDDSRLAPEDPGAHREQRPADAEALAAPESLEERFAQAALLDTYRRAVADSGLDVEIASVDCTEYPCIVYGHTTDDPAVLEAYLAAPAFEPYAGAARVLFSWGGARLTESEELRRYFGAVLYPETDKAHRGARIERRLAVRAAQMWDAVRATGR